MRYIGRSLILVSCVGAGALSITACGGDEGKATPGAAALIANETVPVGDECAEGGVRVRAGVDRNGDADLQDDEVTDEAVICNGEQGADGIRGPVGPDGDDGPEGPQGDPGDPGEQGDPGTKSLLALTTEPKSLNCCWGGVKLEVGLDANANGMLDAGEVDGSQTKFVCNGDDGTTPGCNKYIFITSAPNQGDLGGVAGADAICHGDANKPNGSTYKALLVDGAARVACTTDSCSGGVDEHVDWVLAPNIHYVRPNTEESIAFTNDVGLFTFPLLGTYDLPEGSNEAARIWTGLNTTWTTDVHCSQWGSTGGNGAHARRDAVDVQAIRYNYQLCSDSNALACVEQ